MLPIKEQKILLEFRVLNSNLSREEDLLFWAEASKIDFYRINKATASNPLLHICFNLHYSTTPAIKNCECMSDECFGKLDTTQEEINTPYYVQVDPFKNWTSNNAGSFQ